MRLPTRNKNYPIELEGVNFIKGLFDRANCIFKEISREHDYGHDAFVGLVDGTKVLPREIALQVKSGSSYVNGEECLIPSTEEQRNFWRLHPLKTLGIVYDPIEKVAYWTDLSDLPDEIRHAKGSKRIKFTKHPLNRINEDSFEKITLPGLIGNTPKLSYEEAISWSNSIDISLHYVGLVVLRAHFSDNISTWEHFVGLFEKRKVDEIDGYLIYILAHLNSHGDIWFSGKAGWILSASKEEIISRFHNYGLSEIIKLLELVDEDGFERGSVGQSCCAVIKLIGDFEALIYEVLHEKAYKPLIRFHALCFLYQNFFIDEERLDELIKKTGIDYYSPPYG